MMATEVLSYQFDDVVIDLRAGRVAKGGQPVAIEPKGYDLLVLLASRAGDLVTRQEVLDQVWAGVYVTDNAVARVVAQVRRALGDSARGSRYIETVPTRGYRFIGQVERVMGPSRPPAAATAAPAAPDGFAPRMSSSPLSSPPTSYPSPADAGPPAAHPLWAAALAALALLAIFFAWRAQPPSTERPPAVARVQLTSSAGLDAFPAWSPDGGTLAYASDRSGRFELFLHELQPGGARRALTDDGQHNVQPAWSPDGRRLAYHSSGRGGIWIVARDGGVPRQVSGFGSRPSWSPDGRRLVFQGAPYTEPGAAAFETFGPSSLWVVDVEGGSPRQVTSGWRPEGSHVRPIWFPDGRRVFFASQRLNATAFWVLDEATGALTRVLDAGARAVDATLTPDGRTVYYVRLGDQFDLWKLSLTEEAAAAGTPVHVLSPGELDFRHLAVHPDGRRLAYVAMSTISGLRSLPLHRDGIPAGPSIRLAADAVRAARRPTFSPDGAGVVFERQTAGGPPHLWLLDPAGGERALTHGRGDARDPQWSPDGQRVYYESGDDREHALWALRLDDGRPELIARLADGPHTLLRPRVSPDATRLAYTRSEEGQLEVWVRAMGGGGDVRVARSGDGAAFPVWSPDGRTLAVDVWQGGHAHVAVVDLASGRLTRVSPDVDQAWVRSWSPDGARLAFAGVADGRWNVWTVGRDGSAPRQMTTYGDEHHYVRNPEWSPAGDRLVYEFGTFAGNVWVVPVP